MWGRLSDPGTYQAFQHCITHAPWEAERVWVRLREVVPERTGVLILDGTSFPKQGTASVGVARQYCGARGSAPRVYTMAPMAWMTLGLRLHMRLAVLSLLTLLLPGWFPAPGWAQPLLSHPVHLGVPGAPEWDIFRGTTPHAEALALDFDATTNSTEHTLLIRQSDVKQAWSVEVNGRAIGSLVPIEADLVHMVAIPPATLRDGRNTLRIAAKAPDDIVLREIALLASTSAELLGRAMLEVSIVDSDGAPMPARVTVSMAAERSRRSGPCRVCGKRCAQALPTPVATGCAWGSCPAPIQYVPRGAPSTGWRRPG